MELSFQFGAAETQSFAQGFSLAFGYASRLYPRFGDRLSSMESLEITGLKYAPLVGVTPQLFGVGAYKRLTVEVTEESESGFSWPWLIGGAAAVVAVVAVASSGGDGSSNNSNGPRPSDSGATLTVVGTGDRDGNCDIASGPSATTMTVVEEECLN